MLCISHMNQFKVGLDRCSHVAKLFTGAFCTNHDGIGWFVCQIMKLTIQVKLFQIKPFWFGTCIHCRWLNVEKMAQLNAVCKMFFFLRWRTQWIFPFISRTLIDCRRCWCFWVGLGLKLPWSNNKEAPHSATRRGAQTVRFGEQKNGEHWLEKNKY